MRKSLNKKQYNLLWETLVHCESMINYICSEDGAYHTITDCEDDDVREIYYRINDVCIELRNKINAFEE